MFSIGLFSTHLPYILLAMFYGAYLGINLITGAGQQIDPDKSVSLTDNSRVVTTSNRLKAEKEAYHFDNYTEQTEQIREVPDVAVTCLEYPDKEPQVPRSWFSTSLFSRPPPAA